MGLAKKCIIIGFVIIVSLSWIVAAQAQSAEEFYKGKTVTLMVSAPAGSLTDLLARQFKDYFAKHIPGNPVLIVKNVPGAGGMVAASRLQLEEPRDGTVIGFLQRNNLYVSLVEGKRNNFDPREVNWLGSLDKVYYCIVVSDNSPVKSAEEMFTKTLILGATGFANENRTLPALMNKYIGTKFNIIHGYSGRGEVYLAMERKEVDGWASTIAGLSRGNEAKLVKEGKLIPIVHLAWKSHPDFPNLPNFSNYVKDPEAKAVIDFFLLPFESGRPIAVPKGVPEDRLTALRKAFDDTVKDLEFIATMKKRDWPVDPITGAEVEKIRDQLYGTPEKTLEVVREILKPQKP